MFSEGPPDIASEVSSDTASEASSEVSSKVSSKVPSEVSSEVMSGVRSAESSEVSSENPSATLYGLFTIGCSGVQSGDSEDDQTTLFLVGHDANWFKTLPVYGLRRCYAPQLTVNYQSGLSALKL